LSIRPNPKSGSIITIAYRSFDAGVMAVHGGKTRIGVEPPAETLLWLAVKAMIAKGGAPS
jgi:hypothetical protein